jgi:TRAP-type C4-dicarboxylate transport system permease small subunit
LFKSLRKTADGLIRLSAAIGALGLIFEVGVILTDVIGRALGHPLYGSDEYVSMAMVILVFGGMAFCDRIGGHIAVDLFERYYPRWFNRLTDVVAALMGATIFFGLAWAVHESAKLSVMLNLSTNLLQFPKAWFQNALSIFAIVTGLAMLLRAAELVFRGFDVRIDPESRP